MNKQKLSFQEMADKFGDPSSTVLAWNESVSYATDKEIEKVCLKIIKENPSLNKTELFKKIMLDTNGTINPKRLSETLDKLLT
jgi:hypothetical protein